MIKIIGKHSFNLNKYTLSLFNTTLFVNLYLNNYYRFEQIRIIEQGIEVFAKNNPRKNLFVVLNKSFLLDINSCCLHLATKYNYLQWPKLCINDDLEEYILFIGVVE